MALWGEMQVDLLKLSTRSKQVLATRSGHFVMLDQPDVVIEAIKELVNEYHERTVSDRLQKCFRTTDAYLGKPWLS